MLKKKKNLLAHGEHMKGILTSRVHCLSSTPKKWKDEKSTKLSNFTIFLFKLLVATDAKVLLCVLCLATS